VRDIPARVSKVVTKIEEACLAWGILGIAALTIANVVGRTLFGTSLASAEELSQFLMVFVTFLGLGYAAGKGRHIRMTAIYDALPLKLKKAVRLFITGSTAILLFYLAYLGLRYSFGTVRDLGSLSPALQVPLWLIYLAAPTGFVLAGIQYVLAFIQNVRSEEVYLSFEQLDEYGEAPPPEGI
jgi:TRAP-type C4-dicarboxylate transport system permease small subunit